MRHGRDGCRIRHLFGRAFVDGAGDARRLLATRLEMQGQDEGVRTLEPKNPLSYGRCDGLAARRNRACSLEDDRLPVPRNRFDRDRIADTRPARLSDARLTSVERKRPAHRVVEMRARHDERVALEAEGEPGPKRWGDRLFDAGRHIRRGHPGAREVRPLLRGSARGDAGDDEETDEQSTWHRRRIELRNQRTIGKMRHHPRRIMNAETVRK